MPTPAVRSTVLASCGLLAAGVLLGGCGGGSDRAGSPTPLAAAPSAGATPSGPLSTPTADAEPSTSALSPSAPSTSAPSPGAPSPGGSSPGATSTSPVGAGPAPCDSSRLGISVRADAGGGAAGSVYENVVFVNQGSSTCTLSGHPGVSYVVGTDGHQVGAAAARTGTPASVSLAPGASAHAQLRVINYGNYDLDTCQPSPVAGFRVYPPDQTASAFVAAPGTACADPSIVLLTVGPVEPGSAA